MREVGRQDRHDPRLVRPRRVDLEQQVLHAVEHRLARGQHGLLGALHVELHQEDGAGRVLRREAAERHRLHHLHAPAGRQLVDAARRAGVHGAERHGSRRAPHGQAMRAPGEGRVGARVGLEERERGGPGLERVDARVGPRRQHHHREQADVGAGVDHHGPIRRRRHQARGRRVLLLEQDLLDRGLVDGPRQEAMAPPREAERDASQRGQAARQQKGRKAHGPEVDDAREPPRIGDRRADALPQGAGVSRRAHGRPSPAPLAMALPGETPGRKRGHRRRARR